MSLFVLSDPAFGSAPKARERGFATPADMDRYLIDAWNSAVRPYDVVIVTHAMSALGRIITDKFVRDHLIGDAVWGTALSDPNRIAGWRFDKRIISVVNDEATVAIASFCPSAMEFRDAALHVPSLREWFCPIPFSPAPRTVFTLTDTSWTRRRGVPLRIGD